MGAKRVRLGAASVVAGVLAVSALLAGCSLFPSVSSDQGAAEPPPAGAGVVPPGQMTLSVSNGSTLDVALFVNGLEVAAPIAAGQGLAMGASGLPPLPWAVEVRSPSGRLLVATTVHAGDVWSRSAGGGDTESKGVGARVDLSCGRIDVWSGFPMSGPVPGPGTPGDCVP